MNVGGILNNKGRTVETASPETTLQEVAGVLGAKKIGALIILGSNGKIAGILSERDIVRAIAEGGASTLKKPASEFMTEKVITCSESDTVNQLMESMTQGRFRHLPVVHNGKLTGVMSIGDVVKHRIAEAEFEAEEMKRYISSV
ncbi:MAG: CBS domain-containing protein [Alphaproteobacteria bacterium]|nr:CBS domain-containing protein [Alphaproteobacteria bacterium]